MVLFAKFTQLQRFDNLDEFERAAAKAVGLDYLRVKCRYTPDMLDAKYTGEAVKRLKQDMAVINGHLNGAFYYIDIPYISSLKEAVRSFCQGLALKMLLQSC